MTIQKKIWCDECGAEFKYGEEAAAHNPDSCIPVGVGDRVLFTKFGGEHAGTVKFVGSQAMRPGQVRFVKVLSDDLIPEDTSVNRGAGRHFFVPIFDVRPLTKEEAA